MNKIKIFTIITISFLITQLFLSRIFFANTPRINPSIITSIKNLPSSLMRLSTILYAKQEHTINSQIANSRIVEFPIVAFDQTAKSKISTGVYAGETAYMKYYDLKQSEIEWATMELTTKSGKVVKFQYPKDNPPTKEMLEIIKSE